MSFQDMGQEFLAQKNIAVVGASATMNRTANSIYTTLRNNGYTVYPVHPTAEKIEGDTAYPSVKDLPGPVDGVFIATSPEVTEKVMADCVEANVPRVWMHYNALFGKGMTSVSDKAVAMGRENGITVIDGGCPMMFFDFGHKCMKAVLGWMGKLPQ